MATSPQSTFVWCLPPVDTCSHFGLQVFATNFFNTVICRNAVTLLSLSCSCLWEPSLFSWGPPLPCVAGSNQPARSPPVKGTRHHAAKPNEDPIPLQSPVCAHPSGAAAAQGKSPQAGWPGSSKVPHKERPSSGNKSSAEGSKAATVAAADQRINVGADIQHALSAVNEDSSLLWSESQVLASLLVDPDRVPWQIK